MLLLLEPTGGVAGDMFLAAALDLGVPKDELLRHLHTLKLAGWSFKVEKAQRHGISGTHVDVQVEQHLVHDHDHHHHGDRADRNRNPHALDGDEHGDGYRQASPDRDPNGDRSGDGDDTDRHGHEDGTHGCEEGAGRGVCDRWRLRLRQVLSEEPVRFVPGQHL